MSAQALTSQCVSKFNNYADTMSAQALTSQCVSIFNNCADTMSAQALTSQCVSIFNNYADIVSVNNSADTKFAHCSVNNNNSFPFDKIRLKKL